MSFWIVIGVIVLIALWAIAVYNGLVGGRNQAQTAWSQIDVQLKRRHDLIPNLVQVVKDAMGYEQETLTKVVQARNAAVAASGPAQAGVGRGGPQPGHARSLCLGRDLSAAQGQRQRQAVAGRTDRRPRTRSPSRASSTTTRSTPITTAARASRRCWRRPRWASARSSFQHARDRARGAQGGAALSDCA